MTEEELHAEVVKLCRLRDVWCSPRNNDQRRRVPAGEDPRARIAAGAGYVDTVLIGRAGILFVEEKSDDERRSRQQIRWADRIATAGGMYRLWRPEDLKAGTIADELDKIA